MSRNNKLSNAALILATSLAISACDSEEETTSEGGGGNVQVASDSCLAVPVSGITSSHSGSIASLVDSEFVGQYQFSIVGQSPDGTVTLDSSTGDYEFTPSATMAGARGYKTTFTYGVLESGGQVDSGTVELIYGAKRIMPLGDSITFGVTFYDGSVDNPATAFAIGYRKALYDQLAAGGYDVDFVGTESAGTDTSVALDDTDHQGYPGWRADQLASGNTSATAEGDIGDWLDNATPDIVLSHAGTNDLYQGNTTTQTVTNVRGLIANMQTWRNSQNQPLRVLAAKIIPSYSSGGTTSSLSLADISEFNTNLETNLNAVFGADPDFTVDVVDQYSALDPALDITTLGGGVGQDSNGLHPNTSGYTKMATTWYNALVATGELSKCE